MGAKRRRFTREFELDAVRLAMGDERPLSQVARELGIRPDMLRAWKRQVEGRAGLEDDFPGNGKLSTQEEELRRLRRELELVEQERDFLNKAAAYFAMESR